MQAKKDANQLTGKDEKKKSRKGRPDKLAEPKPELVLAPVLEKKPLPGIKPISSSFSSVDMLSASEAKDNSYHHQSSQSQPTAELRSLSAGRGGGSSLGVMAPLGPISRSSSLSIPALQQQQSINDHAEQQQQQQ